MSIDPTFGKFFEAGNIWYWYVPMSPYKQFSDPFTGLRYYLIRALYYFVLFSMVLLLTLDLIYLATSFASEGDFIHSLTVTVWFVCAVNAYQTTLFTWNRGREVIELLTVLHDDFPKSDSGKKQVDADGIAKDFVAKSGALVKLFFIAFTGMCVAPIVNLIIGYFSNGQLVLQLPLILWFPFDALAMPVYPVIYLLELWFFSLNTFIVLANAALLGAITMVICIQFKILALDLRAMEFCGNFERDFKVMEKTISAHNRILFATKRTKEMFAFQLLVSFTIASIVICIFMFLIVNERQVFLSAIYVTILLCYLAYMGVFAYFGNEIIENVR